MYPNSDYFVSHDCSANITVLYTNSNKCFCFLGITRVNNIKRGPDHHARCSLKSGPPGLNKLKSGSAVPVYNLEKRNFAIKLMN